MQPKKNTHRQQFPGGKYVKSYRFDNPSDEPKEYDDLFSPMDFDFSMTPTFEEANVAINPDMTGDDEKRRIEALKRAIDIAKLMDNVNAQNILEIAELVDKYLQQ